MPSFFAAIKVRINTCPNGLNQEYRLRPTGSGNRSSHGCRTALWQEARTCTPLDVTITKPATIGPRAAGKAVDISTKPQTCHFGGLVSDIAFGTRLTERHGIAKRFLVDTRDRDTRPGSWPRILIDHLHATSRQSSSRLSCRVVSPPTFM
jgi:hypothetical protein